MKDQVAQGDVVDYARGSPSPLLPITSAQDGRYYLSFKVENQTLLQSA